MLCLHICGKYVLHITKNFHANIILTQENKDSTRVLSFCLGVYVVISLSFLQTFLIL